MRTSRGLILVGSAILMAIMVQASTMPGEEEISDSVFSDSSTVTVIERPGYSKTSYNSASVTTFIDDKETDDLSAAESSIPVSFTSTQNPPLPVEIEKGIDPSLSISTNPADISSPTPSETVYSITTSTGEFYEYTEYENEIVKSFFSKPDFVFVRELENSKYPFLKGAGYPKEKYLSLMHASKDGSLFMHGPMKYLEEKNASKGALKYPIINHDRSFMPLKRNIKYLDEPEKAILINRLSEAKNTLTKMLNLVVYDILEKEQAKIFKEDKGINIFRRNNTATYNLEPFIKFFPTSIGSFKEHMKKEGISISDLKKKGNLNSLIVTLLDGKSVSENSLQVVIKDAIDTLSAMNFKKSIESIKQIGYDLKSIKNLDELGSTINNLFLVFSDEVLMNNTIKFLLDGNDPKRTKILERLVEKYDNEKEDASDALMAMRLLPKKGVAYDFESIKNMFIKFEYMKKINTAVDTKKEEAQDIFNDSKIFEDFLKVLKNSNGTGHSIYKAEISYSTVKNIYILKCIVKDMEKIFSKAKARHEIWNYPIIAKYISNPSTNSKFISITYRGIHSNIVTQDNIPATEGNIRKIISARRVGDIELDFPKNTPSKSI